MSTVADKDAQEKANLARIRDNQRRSRARRKEYLEELEQRLRSYEQQGVVASTEIQQAARRVIDENKKLRHLLNERGVEDGTIDSYLRGTLTPGTAASQESPLAALDRLLITRHPSFDSRSTPLIPSPAFDEDARRNSFSHSTPSSRENSVASPSYSVTPHDTRYSTPIHTYQSLDLNSNAQTYSTDYAASIAQENTYMGNPIQYAQHPPSSFSTPWPAHLGSGPSSGSSGILSAGFTPLMADESLQSDFYGEGMDEDVSPGGRRYNR